MEEFGVFSGVYLLLLFCFIFPPPAVVSGGLTVQNIFSSLLSSPNYLLLQMRRTALTRAVHEALVCFYLLSLMAFLATRTAQAGDWIPLFNPAVLWFLLLGTCAVLAVDMLRSVGMVRDPSKHPLVKALQVYSHDWEALAERISEEVRGAEFHFTQVGNSVLKITPSWIVQCTDYHVSVAHQRDVDLSIVGGVEVRNFHATASSMTQILQIKVTSIHPQLQPFVIKLHAGDYDALRIRLDREIRNAQAVVIQQPLGAQFLASLKEIVTENTRRANFDPHPAPHPRRDQEEEEDVCVGCMSTPVEVRFRRSCSVGNAPPPPPGELREQVPPNTPCGDCFCRPLWCLECLGKWFLSQQNPRHPERWVEGKTRCPTCKSVFCLLDIVYDPPPIV